MASNAERQEYPISMRLLLGQLATDVAWAGLGIGTGLIKYALERCVTAAGLVGGRALDDEVAAFWRRRGFTPSRDDPLILFQSIAAITAALQQTRARRRQAAQTFGAPQQGMMRTMFAP
jgi:GNAT superfamily N-acetyltransferase